MQGFIRKRARGKLVTCCCEAVAACKVERGVTRCGDVNTLRAELLLCISSLAG
ncbi:MAG: hypothetical protein ACK55Z_11920 [bacterium]